MSATETESVARGEARALYLHSGSDPIFAYVHPVVGETTHNVAVLVCPPFGWEDMCAHRSLREWAEAFAEAGYPALRFDLPGTNDSAGSPRDPDRLAAWTSAVRDAATWLVEETGATRVVALGLGLGGMLAWLAASEGAPIDDLILWSVPSRGRRLLHHIRSFARLELDDQLDVGPVEGDDAKPVTSLNPGEVLDPAGRIISQETAEALGALDLTKLTLPAATERRVLILGQDGAPPEQRAIDYFRKAGCDLQQADGDGYGSIMQYARFAETPTATIERSLDWLAQSPGTPGPSQSAVRVAGVRSVPDSEVLALREGGIELIERPVYITVHGERLFGIVTEPAGGARYEVCGVFLNPGSNRRVGPNRAWVESARRWAARGVVSIRFDQPGIGDSEGDSSPYRELYSFYNEEAKRRMLEILDALPQAGVPERYVLTGLCAGAFGSYHGAVDDPRVIGAFSINLPFFAWTWWTMTVKHGWLIRKGQRRHILIEGSRWLMRRGLPLATRLGRMLWPVRGSVDRDLATLEQRNTEVLLLFRGGELLYDELRLNGRLRQMRRIPNLHVRDIPGRDHTFRPLALQRFVAAELDEGLDRILARETVTVRSVGSPASS